MVTLQAEQNNTIFGSDEKPYRWTTLFHVNFSKRSRKKTLNEKWYIRNLTKP